MIAGKLQVQIGADWKFVFCRLPSKSEPIVTDEAKKALPGCDIDYFQKHFGNHQFRILYKSGRVATEYKAV